MNVGLIKDSLFYIAEYVPFRLPAMGWRFAAKTPNRAVMPEKETWTCMFSFIEAVADGKRLCLSADNAGCSGAACYLGFKEPSPNAGAFLAEQERFKKTAELGRKFYREIKPLPAPGRYALLERVQDMEDGVVPAVIVLWVDAIALAGLVTLANYDRPTNDNVLIPFASGCQSIWTIPFKESFEKYPRCVVGTMDPAVRVYLPRDVVSFSMPTSRFAEMVKNVKGGFMQTEGWKQVTISAIKGQLARHS